MICHKRWVQLQQQNWSLRWNLGGCVAFGAVMATTLTPKSYLVCHANITYGSHSNCFPEKLREAGITFALLLNVLSMGIGFYSLWMIRRELNNALTPHLEDHSENAEVFASGFKHVMKTILVLFSALSVVFLGYLVALMMLFLKLFTGSVPATLCCVVSTSFHVNALFNPIFLMFRHSAFCPDFLKPIFGFAIETDEDSDLEDKHKFSSDTTT